MSTETTTLPLLPQLSADSRIWIYTADRTLHENEVAEILRAMDEFTGSWTAHDAALKAGGTVLYNRLLILAVDEHQAGASGCSIDKSVAFIRQAEIRWKLRLFDRLNVLWLDEQGQLNSVPLHDLDRLIAQNGITRETRILDTTVLSLGELRDNLVKKAGESWLKRYFS